MDMQTYRERVAKPIAGENPVGERLLDDALLDFVETQMMKVGSLSHAEVQWGEAEQSAMKLIETQTKDLKLLTHLLQCLQYQSSPERFTLSVFILADFITAYWETCYPAPGPRGVLPRRKFFSQIVQRTEKAAEKLDFSMFDVDQKEDVEKALKELETAAEEKDLPTEGVLDIASLLKRKLATPEPQVQQAPSSAPSETASSSASAPSPKLEIDGSSDRAVKQTLLKVAEFVSELDGGIALALRLRRFAVWFSITSAPDSEANGETQLMPVSADRISEYEDQLSRGADHALWRKVEQSLTVAPYWIDGHFLSYRIALKLGNTEWADTIASEVRSFVKRVPAVAELSFKGGMPYVGEETRRWLDEGDTTSTGSATTSDWDGKRKEAFTLADEGGLSVALAMLNDGLSTSKEPRDQFYWRMLSADVMKRHNLSAMADQHYHQLLEQANHTSLTDWEPALIQRLENIAKS
ncbi:type VI secretion protein [Grimontia sp. AD028]|uniref:type VI secretion system protein TssA n=1 Tax=Grimontia sp. AD028 TaxID=1581149 RepID=UPI00061A8C3D|nr:type VI secretion system protein TssA [Grimontia sp. AD028]KKD61745.1 type VI secretion protein [Grimontia sp. AD028]